MSFKILIVVFISFFVNGCKLLSNDRQVNEQQKHVPPQSPTFCVWEQIADRPDCDMNYWLNYWVTSEEISWPERQTLIESLSDDDADLLKKVFLSQGKSTPYQNRLRAQIWAESLFPKLSDDMKKFIQVAVYQPSQSLLEMESALVTLSKINTQQMSKVEQQKLKLEEQKNQIQQLMNIETTILQSNQGKIK